MKKTANTTTVINNVTTNNMNNIKEDNTMKNTVNNTAKNNITRKVPEKMNRVQFLKQNNSKLEYFYIDNIPVGVMGSMNEKDKEAGLKVIQRIVDNSDKTGMALVMEVMAQVQFEANMTEKEIEPDEVLEITVDGVTYPTVLSVKDSAIYDEAGEKIADISDLGDVDMPLDALRAILKARGELAIKADLEKKVQEANNDDCDEDSDDDWDW